MAERITLKPIKPERIIVQIEGTSPMIQHQWTEKARRQLREKKGGKKTRDRTVCDPAAECEAATYRTADGQCGIPVDAVKACLIGAAHKDLGIEKTLVKKGLFVLCPDANRVIAFASHADPRMREDCVRPNMGGADLRYRPQFDAWAVDLDIEYNPDLLTPAAIVNLIGAAGFGVGLCEWRPEKGGEFGRFRVRTE